MNPNKKLNQLKIRRKRRVRAKIFGTAQRPRFSVFRSNRHSYVQLIDDENGKTLVSASTKETAGQVSKMPKTKQAEALGELIAKKALTQKIKTAVFDRGSYKYHGRIKAMADAARRAGLKF